MNQSQRGKLLNLYISLLIHAEIHYDINDSVAYQFVEERLMVRKQRNGKHSVRSYWGGELAFYKTDDELKQFQTNNLVDHVGVETYQSCHPT